MQLYVNDWMLGGSSAVCTDAVGAMDAAFIPDPQHEKPCEAQHEKPCEAIAEVLGKQCNLLVCVGCKQCEARSQAPVFVGTQSAFHP